MGKLKTSVSPVKKVLQKSFTIVGFGASAGGLEAFIEILKHLDSNLGMAYVLVMHLSPNHKSALAEILQTKTKMKVHTVKDGMKVVPNNVYVIPPNVFMSLVDGHLKLAPRDITTIGNFAVDYFLHALATIYKNKAIGVILSGTATDGTLGLRAIKTHGGITLVQDSTAKFPGMPKHAYDSGYADFILSPSGIAKELSILKTFPYTVLPTDKVDKVQQKELKEHSEELKKILAIVETKFGVDFFLQYKQASIYRRVVRRMVLNKFDKLKDYATLLAGSPKEVDSLYDDFLINVTTFFRDPDFYNALNEEIFPSIIKKRKVTDPVRIWVAGCATGEEAYSIAMSLLEYCSKRDISVPINIFASDLDTNAIEKARVGIYPLMGMLGVPQDYLKRYFKKIDGHYRIEKSVREICVFAKQNLLKDPPFSRMDLISCQNVLIYLETKPQRKILENFHYALKPAGYLFLGKSETVGSESDLFSVRDKKFKVYSRKSTHSPRLDISSYTKELIPPKEKLVGELPALDIEKDVSKLLLTRFVAPSVVLDQNLNIIQFYGVTAPYLSPIVGKASLSVLKMIREDLLIDVRTLLQQARKTIIPVIKEGIRIYNNKSLQEISIEVVPRKTGNELFYLVVFQEKVEKKSVKGKNNKVKRTVDEKAQNILKLEEELILSREVIRNTNEEYETTYEELQANNEEILSSNEELQSLNEELETSKEELQSSNEELTTINEELQKRNLELKDSHTYSDAIIQTMHNPLLVLTANLQVRMANDAFYRIFKLTPENTESTFLFDLGDGAWEIPLLRDELNNLLNKKSTFKEFELTHTFPNLGELVLDIHAYKLFKDENFKETLILLAFNNVGELLKSNRQLKKANEELEQYAFISSHDLQEPLRKIATFSDLLLSDKSALNEHAKIYAEKINSSTVKMSALLKDLLNYSLLKGRDRVKVQVDLNTMLKEIVLDFDLVIEKAKAVINVSSLPVVAAEPVQISRLFHNLIGNALKFISPETPPVINVSSRDLKKTELTSYPELNKERDYVLITISDNGIGFDQKYADKLFILFSRLHVNNADGTGIGLAICKKIVENHDGIIFATGAENTGANFNIILPVS